MALELPDDQLATLGKTGALTLQRRSQLAYEQVTFNQASPNPLTGQPPPWKNDPALLQALRMAIDRPGLVKKFFRDLAQLAESPIPSALTSFHDPGVSLDYDLGAANKLLDGDGWAIGPDQIRTGESLAAPRVRAMARAALFAERAPPVLDGRGIEHAQPFDAGVDAASAAAALRRRLRRGRRGGERDHRRDDEVGVHVAVV